MGEESFYKELASVLKQRKIGKIELSQLKIKLCKKHGMKNIPTDIQLLLNTNIKFTTKPSRTGSGVAVIAIMTAPMKCPHGKCIFCPGGPKSEFGDVPQSYTGKEPATMRGIRNFYDPYFQVFNRLEQYVVMGHSPEKAELIIMGGTFPSFPKSYRDYFIKFAFKAMNDFSRMFYKKNMFDIEKFKSFFELPGPVGDPTRTKNVHAKLKKLKGTCTLISEQKKNQKSNIRCVGLTVETRPDYGKLKQANDMLRLGATRVEIGVQSVYEDVLVKVERGHSVADTIESIQILKDLGFKINAHYMPGLPGVDRTRDLAGMKQLFENPDFRPDMLKIYPCMVVKGTKLFDMYKKGEFHPISAEQAAEVIAEFKRYVPKYVRIMRVQRDISSKEIEAGVKRTNLRQYIDVQLKNKGIVCQCIRCREPKTAELKNAKILVYEYPASKGTEFFISAENKENLFGFCRLRFPSSFLRKEITKDSALLRELHVYGSAAGLGEEGEVQHKGLGKQLLKTAEGIAKANKKKKIVVISGIGVRPYYKKLGYKLEGPYMVKNI
jgi:elongator complex protein 3